jgi:glycosyltransferase involved in cell wall biosynthesis
VTLRVLSISTLFPRPDKPGFGRFVARQFEALAAREDVELTLINPIPRPLFGGKANLDTSRPFPVHHVPLASIPRFGARWNPALIARAVLPLVHRLHAGAPFDLVDAQFFYPDGPAAARIATALGLPLTIKARGSDILYWGEQPFARRQILAAADQAKALLAVSEALKRSMVNLGITADKIAVHHTGLDHDLFQPRPRTEARRALIESIPAEGALFASVGNLVALKGHAFAIEALAEVPDAQLAIAGLGEERARLQALATRLGLAERVHFLGGLGPEQVARLLAAADAMVLPSEREGLANVWIEALASGTPLVITDVGGAREVVRSPAAGRLVARSPEAIAAAMRELLANPPDQASVAAEAAHFSWEANAAQLAAHYFLVAG